MKIAIIKNSQTDPYLNLAIEDYLLRQWEQDIGKKFDLICFFYRNDPCVVLGNFQCLWKEIPIPSLNKLHQEFDLKIVRRQSGGGTVYHDKGNINFSFLFNKDEREKNFYNQLLMNFFKDIGLNVSSSGRDDLGVLKGETFYKFSGQAFKQTRDRILHHGTLLFDANLPVLKELCFPNTTMVKSKSVDSVVSQVVNLRSLLTEIQSETQLIEQLHHYLEGLFDATSFEVELNNEILEKKREYESDQFVFYKTPRFQLEFNNIRISIEKSLICAIEFLERLENPGEEKLIQASLLNFPLSNNLINSIKIIELEKPSERVSQFLANLNQFILKM